MIINNTAQTSWADKLRAYFERIDLIDKGTSTVFVCFFVAFGGFLIPAMAYAEGVSVISMIEDGNVYLAFISGASMGYAFAERTLGVILRKRITALEATVEEFDKIRNDLIREALHHKENNNEQ